MHSMRNEINSAVCYISKLLKEFSRKNIFFFVSVRHVGGPLKLLW